MNNTTVPVDKVERIREVLRSCDDPELSIDIINLGLVYDIQVNDDTVQIIMTLTTPGCPLAPYFQRRITDLIHEVYPKADVKITFTFDPPWSPEKMTLDGKRTLTMLRG